MRKVTLFAPAVVMTGVVAGLFFPAPMAQADVTVCAYLDAHPTPAGVEDLFGMAEEGNGMTTQQAAKFIWDEVNYGCPRHYSTLKAYIEKWLGPLPAKGTYT